MMAVVHNAAMMFPAKVLGDRELWPKLRADLESWLSTDDNERSLIPQWEACLLYDQMEALPACTVPMHVIAFSEDVQAPPQDGREVARDRRRRRSTTSSRAWATARSTGTRRTS